MKIQTEKSHRNFGVVFLFALFLAFSTTTETILAKENVFSPHDVAKLQTVGKTLISPDGNHVAYLLSVPRNPLKAKKDGPSWTELHVLDCISGKSRPFITGEVKVSGMEWTPDGTGISFLSKRGEDKETSLYVIPLHGGEAKKVLTHETGIKSYSWSPDGKHVAFLATEKLPEEIKEWKDKGFKAQIYEEDWRPTKVWIANIETEEEEAKPEALDLTEHASSARWSPRGDQIAVALAPTSLVDDSYMKKTLHVINVETREITGKWETPGKIGSYRWSPDGAHIAIIAAEDLNDHKEGRLMLGSANGGELRDLLPGYEAHVKAIAWKDTQTICFLGDEGVWTTWNQLGIQDLKRKTLIPTGGTILLTCSLSQDGKQAAFTGQSPLHPNELFLMQESDSKPRRMTDSNPWLNGMRLATQEVIQFKVPDGLELEGILLRPLDEVKGERYPLILTVHGGPEAHYRNGWLTWYSSPGQVAAARGFAVFYPNYRGSTGRGVAFGKLSHGDPAGKEFDDLVDAVDHLIGMGLVDRDRVGITGGSYGGFASAWGATYYTERFAASAMFVGISDKISKFGTTDIPYEMYYVHDPRWPWEDWKFFLERSPIYYTTKARTPLLILHGKDDTRVHPSQSMELYRHLKVLDQTPVRLVFYPGEGHGNKKAAARLDYSLRMLRWMEHYLKGPGGDPPPYQIEYEEPKEEAVQEG